MNIAKLSLTRNRFFAGKLLTPEDLELEQQYFREKLKRHNRYLHGFGVVTGLAVSQSASNVTVSEGLAIDCEGNEIIVTDPLVLATPLPLAGQSNIYLALRYVENERDPVPVPASDDFDAPAQNSRIEESFTAEFEKENINQGHRHIKGRWRSCGEPHGMVIARLRYASGQWRLDRRYRRPPVK